MAYLDARHKTVAMKWLLAACMALAGVVPAGQLVLCFGADGHMAVELPHDAGQCVSLPISDDHETHDCEHHVAPSASADPSGDCIDHCLNREQAPGPLVSSGPLPKALPAWEGRTVVDPECQVRLRSIRACCPPPYPPPTRTIVLLI